MRCKQSECAKNKTQNDYRRRREIVAQQRHTGNDFNDSV